MTKTLGWSAEEIEIYKRITFPTVAAVPDKRARKADVMTQFDKIVRNGDYSLKATCSPRLELEIYRRISGAA